MTVTNVSCIIKAPVEEVFDAVAHIDNFRQVVSTITDVEFLSEQRRGVGTRFRETRVMGRREATTELEVTEYQPSQRIRLVADEGGSIWDTVFTTQTDDDGTLLELSMVATPHTMAARILNPLTKGIVAKAIKADLEAVKAYCESPATSAPAADNAVDDNAVDDNAADDNAVDDNPAADGA